MYCRICQSKNINPIFNLGKQPLANKYPKNEFEKKNEKLYNMDVFFCSSCTSCQLKVDIPRHVFFEDYYYLSSVNKELKFHFEQLANEIKNKNFVLDIGSNDGILLSPLKKKKIKCIGIDPSENVGEIANSRGLKTIISFFNEDACNEVIKYGGKPDCIVASSIFTHLENLDEFIKDLKLILSTDGVFILEVEYLNSILKNLQFERFYFDRPNYFTLKSIKLLFEKHGLIIVNVKKLNTHGESLRIYIKKNNKNVKVNKSVLKILKEENIINENYINSKFSLFAIEIKKLKEKLQNFKNQNVNVIGYGAPARLATITNFGKIDNTLISIIIDDSELKSNRFSPGMHIPIKKFDSKEIQNTSTIILFAYEYFYSITDKMANNNFKYYKPIPFIEMVK